MHTDDIELIDLFKRLGIGIIFIIVFCVAFFFVLLNRFSPQSPKVISEIKKNKSVYVLIDDNSCSNCKKIKEILKEEKVSYFEINIDKASYYDEFLKSISSTRNEVSIPTMMFIKDGKLDSTIVDINDEEILKSFLENTRNNIE